MTPVLASLCALALSGVVPHRPATKPRALTNPNASIFASRTPKVLLRGDWEPPNVVAFVYEPEWEDEVAQMIGIAAESAGILLIIPTELEEEASKWLEEADLPFDSLRAYTLPLDSPWIRDFGPFQVSDRRGHRFFVDTLYDHSDRPNDDKATSEIAALLGASVRSIPLPIDGGALVSNGAGLCVMTQESFHQTALVPDEREARELAVSLGCRAIALIDALAREETKHADIAVQFAGTNHVLIGQVDAHDSAEDHEALEEAVDLIREAAARIGTKMKVSRIDLPVLEGRKYRTYVNGLRLGDVYLVPSYGDVDELEEARAMKQLSRALPKVRLIPIQADEMIDLMGAVHCLSLGLWVPGAGPHWGADRLQH